MRVLSHTGCPAFPTRVTKIAQMPQIARIIVVLAIAVPGLAAAQTAVTHLFATSDNCVACHNGLVTADGRDISIGDDWSASMMANSARDPYWQAAVRREIMDHPTASAEIQDECSACHMPMARYEAKAAGRKGQVFAHLPVAPGTGGETALAHEGVSCAMCHQILPDGLGTPASFTAGFAIDEDTAKGGRQIFGPFEVTDGRKHVMSSASLFEPGEGGHIQDSGLCGSCHTLYTHSRGEDGEIIATLPEQMPYLEWEHSDYPGRETCQSCHMPVVEGETPVSAVLGEPRQSVSRHVFRGGNFFMLRMLNRYRGELGVTAAPRDLEEAARRTVEHLQSASAEVEAEAVRRSGTSLEAVIRIRNKAGHKLPSAYPSRRAWLHVTVTDSDGTVVFESGRLRSDGSIAGNDNDEDPRRHEPHHDVLDDPSKVQIYEGILADPDGRVTTGLLTATHYTKDNRLLPTGFDKTTAAEDIAVQGAAADDADFAGGGDVVRYRVDMQGADGPFTVEAALWYQPIAYRWARNLAPYDALETRRFVRYYESMAAQSGVVLDRDRAEVR